MASEPIKWISDGQGPELVLIHCLGVDHHFWDFAAPLGARFTLLRYDLPGHGQSSVPDRPYGIAQLTDQLAAALKERTTGSVHVAGISLGGLIAQDLAARYPDSVSRLILIDTTPRYTDDMRRMWAERAATARSVGVAAMVNALLTIWFSDEALAANTPAVRYVRDTLKQCSGQAYALACGALAAADLRGELANIASPTLVICGDNDIPSFIDAAHELAGGISCAKLLWIKGARHASVIEMPQEGISLIQSFLEG